MYILTLISIVPLLTQVKPCAISGVANTEKYTLSGRRQTAVIDPHHTHPFGESQQKTDKYGNILMSTWATVNYDATAGTRRTFSTFAEDCDYIGHTCMRAFKTGRVCARTMYYNYHTFLNYCQVEYVNCMQRYEVWLVAYMGPCFKIRYPYQDHWTDQYNEDFMTNDYVRENLINV